MKDFVFNMPTRVLMVHRVLIEKRNQGHLCSLFPLATEPGLIMGGNQNDRA